MVSITELKAFSAEDLMSVDALMNVLSESATCNKERLVATVEDPNSHLFVARDNKNTIVGCATLCVCNTPEQRIGLVEAVAVLPSAQGHGIGRQLMEAIMSYAATISPIKLHLTSRPARIAANKLYQSLGFKLKETNVYEK